MKITVDTFDKALDKFVKAARSAREQAHGLAVFTLAHAQEHGCCERLNRFMAELTKGEQAQLKRYAVMVTTKQGEDVSTSWLGMEKGRFKINTKIKDRVAYAPNKTKDTLDSASNLIDYPSFLNIDPDKVKNPFDTSSLITGIERLVKKAEAEESDVDSNVVSFARRMADSMSAMVAKKEDMVTRVKEREVA